MKLRNMCIVAGLLCLALPGLALAQPERYELGRRVGAFELAWDKYTDVLARKKAAEALRSIPLQTISMQFEEAGRAFDEARHALMPAKEVTPETIWAESLQVIPATRLLDAGVGELPFLVKEFYKTKTEPLKDARLGLARLPGNPFFMPIAKVPMEGKWPLQEVREGDHLVHMTIRTGDRIVAQTLFKVSIVKDLKARMAKLRQAVTGFGNKIGTVDQETVRAIYYSLEALASKEVGETDYPAARLLAEAEAAVAAMQAGQSYYGGAKTGLFWLRLPNGKSAVTVRLLAPDNVKEQKPLPLVIAMHGLGGSENLFFEAYGSGLAVKLCRERGWLLAAPRGGLLNPYSAADVVDEIAKLYPVDKSKVFVVGHSIGAGQAVTAVQQSPNRFAAVAALGGGGVVKPKANMKNISFLVGVGTNDLAFILARGLAEKLKKAGASPVAYREYADIDHFVVVREALPDVFAMFDKIAGLKGAH